MARIQANLVEWIDEKGYGFAREPGGTERIFVHARAFAKGMPWPRKGDEIELELIKGHKGPAARNVRILSAEEITRLLPYHVITATMLFIMVMLVVILKRAPFGLAVYYALMSGVSVYLYNRDKQAALFGWWRISEAKLLAVDFLGGIVGGLLAQHRYHHKKSKPSYQSRIFFIVLFHSILLGGLGSGLITIEGMIASTRSVMEFLGQR